MAVDLYEDLEEAITDEVDIIESVIKAWIKVEKAVSDTLKNLENEYPKANNVKLLLEESKSRDDLDKDILNQIKDYLWIINGTLEEKINKEHIINRRHPNHDPDQDDCQYS